jgi:hypothetical protein
MPYRRLYLLLEGDDDERFAQRVIVPALHSHYDHIQPWQYAQQKTEKVNSFLRSIKAMGASYFFLADINAQPCVSKRKDAVSRKFAELEVDKALIVVKEIESWYLAGVPQNNQLGVQVPLNTSGVTKEQFDAAIPKDFDSRIDYMIEILKLFNVDIAAQRNPSFQYLAQRCGILSAG